MMCFFHFLAQVTVIFRNISGCELSMSMCFAVVVDNMQFDPILNVSSLQCAWDIYSTPSMGEVTEPTPVYSLEIRKQQINSP